MTSGTHPAETTEWGDSATIGADTGSVSFDRTVYPVPAAGSEAIK